MSTNGKYRTETDWTKKSRRQIPDIVAERATGGMAISGGQVGTWNVRGQNPGEWVSQAIHESIKRDLGVVCLTEVNCGGFLDARTVEFHDIAGDTWNFLSVGEEAGNTRGTGFLVAPRYEVVEMKAFSPRVSVLTLTLSKDPFWGAVMGTGQNGNKRRQEPEVAIGVVSCYAPTESKASPADIDDFYSCLDGAVSYFRGRHGFSPVVGGDFNVNVGEHKVEDSEPYESVTGSRVLNRKSSPNCTFLYTWCVKQEFVVANTFDPRPRKHVRIYSQEEQKQKERAWGTWFHPRTKTPHVKDLILVPRGSLETISGVYVDHGAACGNNDHSLVVLGLKSLTRKRWRHRANIVVRGFPSPDSSGSRRFRILPNRGGGQRRQEVGGRGFLGQGTTPRPGKPRMTELEFKVVSKKRREALKLELRKRLEPLPAGWQHTAECVTQVCGENLARKDIDEVVPLSWIEMSGGAIGQIYNKIALLRSKLLGNQSVRLKADMIAARLKAKREKRRCQRIWKLRLVRISEGGSKRNKRLADQLLEGKFKKARDGPSPEAFKTHFESLFGKQSEKQTLDLSNLAQIPAAVEANQECSGPPSALEIREAIKKLKNNKAAGADGIPSEFFKMGDDVIVSRLEADYKDIWPSVSQVEAGGRVEVPQSWQDATVVTLHKKGAISDPGNYRGIFLLEVAGKILTSILASRVSTLADPWLRDEQCGFRKKRSTLHQILPLRRLQEEAIRASKPLCAVFVDFKKAFDSPPREAIWECLRHIGVPQDAIAVAMAIHRDPKGNVLGGDEDSAFDVLRGVRQGCTLGPVLFNILLEFCLRAAGIVDIGIRMVTVDKAGMECPADLAGHSFTFREGGYADDLYFVAETPEQLNRALAKLQDVCGSIGLDISPGKTEWLWLYQGDADLCRNIDNCCAQVRLNDQIIKHCREFCYLGSIVSEGGGVSEALGNRLESARAALDRLESRWTDCLSRGKKIKQVHQKVFPLLLYGTETFPCRKEDYQRVEVFLNRVRLRILGRKRLVNDETLPNEDLHRLVKLPSAVRLMLPRRILFLIQLVVNPACEIARKSIWMELEVPGKVRSGTTISHNPRVLRSEMLFLLRNSDGQLGIEGGKDSQDRMANGVLKKLMEEYAIGGKKNLRKLLDEICENAGSEHPRLSGIREKLFFCKHANCSQAYKEQKFLSRHEREAHFVPGDLGGSQPNVIAEHPISERLATETEEPVATREDKPAEYHCSFCSKMYKTPGWLARHLKTAHVNLSPPPLVPTVVGIPPSREGVPSASRGLRCEVCGKGAAKGRKWGEKTLQNHMAAEHRINAKTGQMSRTRKTKEHTVES